MPRSVGPGLQLQCRSGLDSGLQFGGDAGCMGVRFHQSLLIVTRQVALIQPRLQAGMVALQHLLHLHRSSAGCRDFGGAYLPIDEELARHHCFELRPQADSAGSA